MSSKDSRRSLRSLRPSNFAPSDGGGGGSGGNPMKRSWVLVCLLLAAALEGRALAQSPVPMPMSQPVMPPGLQATPWDQFSVYGHGAPAPAPAPAPTAAPEAKPDEA